MSTRTYTDNQMAAATRFHTRNFACCAQGLCDVHRPFAERLAPRLIDVARIVPPMPPRRRTAVVA